MTEPFKKTGSGLFHMEKWEKEEPGLSAGFTSKEGGSGKYNGLNMAFHVHDEPASVQQNRKNTGQVIGFPVDKWIGCEQTHDVHIAHVSNRDIGRGALDYETAFSSTDGLYTDDAGVLLTLCYADCVPLYFIDRVTKRIGTAHAGWKGAVSGIGPIMIKKWEQEGSCLQDIEVAIGPSICGSCYKVGASVITAAEKWYKPGEEVPFSPVPNEPDMYYFSLQTFNKDLLIKKGISPENIYMTALCSSCSPDFFSHRRDRGYTGRMMGYIGWKEGNHES
ncbi:peptidoglycan editing factor PgeF [Domibacillus sp. A3M-37]|uniref:peptidoglycan editing factor PgeF n=1 Tax=Domibacillus TaxID=1433999 RepID=UPI000617D84B|nr:MULTISPECIES: peptidoglycan editing factor PgeF [Domibacillus]MCP3761919.1 peptidoglycan editing factor PgeF [Domibacillus sp. A3M-37]